MNDHVAHGGEPAELMARQSIFAFASTVTVPLVVLGKSEGEDPVHRGSGVLFAARDRYFLITAAHVLKGAAVGRMSIPPRGHKEPLQPIGKVEMWLPHEEKFDVAVLEFLESGTIENLRRSYRFVGPENIGNANLESGALLCGFPETNMFIKNKRLSGEPLFVDSTPLKKVPAGLDFDLVEGFELFGRYARRGYSPNGREVDTPDLLGASGGGVWQYGPSKPGIWIPEENVRLVAVQNSRRHSEFFRAMTWAVVHQTFLCFAPKIAQDIHAAVFPHHGAGENHLKSIDPTPGHPC